jgi:FkbM family methyltransferase
MALPRNWFRRYVWRRDLRQKLAQRARLARRRQRRDDLGDIRGLFAHRSPRVVLDVGANVGYETDRFLRAFPDAVVHAFEPTPTTFARLEQDYADHPRVRLHQCAVSAERGAVELRVDDDVFAGGSNSLLDHSARFLADQATAAFTTVTVPAVRLDDVCTEAGITHVDLLKLDVEGAELLALTGAQDLLERSAIDVIDAEVRMLPDYEGQPLLEDLLVHLGGLGYRLFNLYGDAEAPTGQLLWANGVWLSEPFRAELTARLGRAATRFD